MPTIAMTREMGTQGRDVALLLAERLGLELVHHELIEHEIAERTHQPESEVHKFLEGGPTLWSRIAARAEGRLAGQTAEQVLEMASLGNVILRGWGAANLLRNFPHILRVRVCAPMEKRVSVIMERTGITDRYRVTEEIERSDAAHTRVIKKFFHGDWRSPEHYDLVLNTERLSVQTCVDQIMLALSSGLYAESDTTRQAISDRLIDRRLRRRLDSDFSGWRTAPAIDIRVSSGLVELNGSVRKDQLRDEIERLATQMTGVVGVRNNLTQLANSYDDR